MSVTGGTLKPARPNPDTLLARLKGSESRGRCKIYLGMSAGVGKTYGMLSDAIAAKKRGRDIVAGYVEPHNRAETRELALQMESIPTRDIVHSGITLRELDIDATLARKPEVVLVDELAHSNAPGSRHSKRWQDIQELLTSGIDVWTTVNVQHFESLRDIVGRITGVTIHEVVPDVFLESADEVEVVDIPPDELIARLREGRIYSADKVEQALQNFFQKGKLIALRELALRHAAKQVDAQLLSYRDEHFVRESWPTSERFVVCIAPNALSSRVVRAASRAASAVRAELIAVSVESPRYASLSESQRQHGRDAMKLAERLGARVMVRSARDVVAEIVAVAHELNASAIVVGKPLRARWREVVFGSVVDELVRASGDIAVYVVSGGASEGTPVKHAPRSVSFSSSGMLAVALMTIACTALGKVLHPTFDLANIIMVYLLGVAWVSTRYGPGEAIAASFSTVAAFDFFFVEPQLTFAVADAQYLVTFATMLVVSTLLSTLTLQIRAQTKIAVDRENRTAHLYELTQRLADARNAETAARVVLEKLRRVFRRDVAIFLKGEGESVDTPFPSESGFELEQNEQAVARWVVEHGLPAGSGTDTLAGAVALYLPLISGESRVGALGLVVRDAPLSAEDELLCEAFSLQVAATFGRLQSREESIRSHLEVERERLRSTLLSAVSHDLRTPLASITGAASALVEREGMDPTARRELATSIVEEAQRLSKILGNILDITRLESSSVTLSLEWNSVEELIGSALGRVRTSLGAREVSVSVEADLPLVKLDALLFEQVLINLLENAAKHTPVGTPVEITARRHSSSVVITVADRGPGIDEGDEKRIFEKLYRGSASGQGFGLGLTISRAILTVLGGTIEAENRPEGGARFSVARPVTETPPHVPADFDTGGVE
ncbi:MAG: sensor histidine kinase KdpD [Deltaproteobacteria bacterium]|nr:sensor histidine kinase KdpD [Deltaproteobacteria bacterium]